MWKDELFLLNYDSTGSLVIICGGGGSGRLKKRKVKRKVGKEWIGERGNESGKRNVNRRGKWK